MDCPYHPTDGLFRIHGQIGNFSSDQHRTSYLCRLLYAMLTRLSRTSGAYCDCRKSRYRDLTLPAQVYSFHRKNPTPNRFGLFLVGRRFPKTASSLLPNPLARDCTRRLSAQSKRYRAGRHNGLLRNPHLPIRAGTWIHKTCYLWTCIFG